MNETTLDTQSEVHAEANEYYAYLTNDKGLEGDELVAALKEERDKAREWDREDLAEAIDGILQDADDGEVTRRFVTSKGDVVDSSLTDPEAIKILRDMEWSDFAQSMVEQYDKPANGKKTPDRRLSPKQWPWAHKLANDQLERQAERERQKEQARTYEEIPSLFRKALDSGHRTPKITLDLDQGKVRLAVAGDMSLYPGDIHVTDGRPYGENIYYGRIEKADGTFRARRDCPDWVKDVLAKLNDETLDFVVKYGQRTGNCCFCNSKLTTTESVSAGYGPICASRYNLPWG